MQNFNDIMRFISSYQIVGVVPLDLTLHFLVGMVWTIIGLRKNFSFSYLFWGIVTIALLKESYDYFFHYKTVWTEYASDFSVTLVYIGIVFFVRKYKKKIKKNEQSTERWDFYD